MDDGNPFDFMSKSQACDVNTDRDLTLNGTTTTADYEDRYSSARGTMNFDKESFMRTHDINNTVVVNPEKRVKKLLLSLIDLYTEVFDKNIFNEVH